MTTEERNQKLQQATDLITDVRDSFNNERKICEHCGFELFVNYNDKQLRALLSGAITRLTRVMERASVLKVS